MRELETPGPRGHRAGERAPLVPEELRLGQSLRERGAVHGHERPGLPGASPVDRLRHELLARSALAGHEDGRVGGSHLLDDREKSAHARALAHEPAVGLRA